ncbi:MAG: electron transfer flavoprotein subunit alpha [Chloroflexi bacterium]|nr:MAG: electron transfer flavoprotein subunit alpha [Chloroflexota bacterium]
MSKHKGVLVCGEVTGAVLTSIDKELLGAGRKLADDLAEELSFLLMGDNLGSISNEAIAYGADQVYVASGPMESDYQSDTYVETITQVCQELFPSILILGHTDIGAEIAPRVAARLNTALVTDCVDLRIDPETKLLVRTKPIYGGNALAEIISESRPQMVTVRPKSFSPVQPDETRQGKIIPVTLRRPAPAGARLIEKFREDIGGPKLEDAEVVVCGGAGVAGPEGFNLLRKLAEVLGGAVGATRVPCQEGWVPPSLEIGQTGKVVAPKLYIAVGVSGAMQHIAGCLGSKFIVAINTDPEANIFKVADFGIVADFKEALPAFIETCKQLLHD